MMSKYDLMLDLKVKVGHCDLYFMVHSAVDNFFVDGVQYTSCW